MIRLTAAGYASAALAIAVGGLAIVTGDNRIGLLGALAVGLWVVEVVGALWGPRGVTVTRRLPPELWANTPAVLRYTVHNAHRWMPLFAVELQEPGQGAAEVGAIPAGRSAAALLDVTFPERGPVALATVDVCLTHPFGWLSVRVRHSLPAEVTVYPRPAGGHTAPLDGGDGEQAESRALGDGDFGGLRPYQPGDPPRRIHWPTTARLGVPMVALRAAQGHPRRIITVDGASERFEREIARACGEVVRAFRDGAEVGLILPSGRFEPRSGEGWRRTLLTALAREPVGSTP